MPVHDFRIVSAVDYIDGDGFAFGHPQNRAGRRAVVANGPGNFLRSELDVDRADPEREIGFGPGRGLRACHGGESEGADELPAIHAVSILSAVLAEWARSKPPCPVGQISDLPAPGPARLRGFHHWRAAGPWRQVGNVNNLPHGA